MSRRSSPSGRWPRARPSRDVGRVLGVPYQQVDAIAKLVPNELKMTLDRALSVSADLKQMRESDPKVAELLDMARKIEGMPRHASTHAAGVVITRDPVDSYVPLYKAEETMPVTQFTMTTLEELGLLKMDFLGLRTLTVISYAEKEAAKRSPGFRADSIPLDDPDTFAMLTKGQCVGVFQFESAGMRNVIAQLGPESIEDLIAVISLYRPGRWSRSPPTSATATTPARHLQAPAPQADSRRDLRVHRLPGAGHADLPRARRLLLRGAPTSCAARCPRRSTM